MTSRGWIAGRAALAAWAAACVGANAEVALIARIAIPPDAHDKSELTGVVGASVAADQLGAFGSGLDHEGAGWRFVTICDRGPGDGGSLWRTRFHRIELTPGATPESWSWTLLETRLLSSVKGAELYGASGMFDAADQRQGRRYDPEAIRVAPTGNLFISDEYGPWIDEFTPEGKMVRRIAPPAEYMVERPDGLADPELARNTSGRQSNRGFEGLALTPDGSRLLAFPQSPLLQDNGLVEDAAAKDPKDRWKRVGINIRVLETTPSGAPTRELVYTLEHPRNGVNEALAVSQTRFLVLERDGKPGAEASFRAVYVVDAPEKPAASGVEDEMDVSGVERLPARGLPPGARAMHKALFLDLMDPRHGLAGAAMPEKIEGLAFGPDLPDGRRTLVVSTDNDLKSDEPTWLWVFAFDAADLTQSR